MYLPIGKLRDSPQVAPSSLNLQAPARTQGSKVPTMPERGNHPGPLLMWDALFPPRQSVRTSSCPGQETAARRPPGRRGGLSPLAPPSSPPAPPPHPPTPRHGKGSEEPCRPETCSDQKPGLADPGQGWVQCLAHLCFRFCSSCTLSPCWLLPCLE